MKRDNRWVVPVLVVLALIVLACCVLAAVSAAVGWVADDAAYGPMMRQQRPEGNCPGCPGGGPMGMRAWLGPVLLLVFGLAALALVAAVVVGALVWTRRSNRPLVDETRDVPETPEIED